MIATNTDEKENENGKKPRDETTTHDVHGENLFSCEMKSTLFNSFLITRLY